MNAEKAFKNFFKGKSKFPKFKKKNKSDVKMYFVKTDAKTIISCERHRIKIPTLGWVQLKEKGYIVVTQVKEDNKFSHNIYKLIPCPQIEDTQIEDTQIGTLTIQDLNNTKNKNNKPAKKKQVHGEFGNVKLYDNQYKKIIKDDSWLLLCNAE